MQSSPVSGDRVPRPDEILNCSHWLRAEMRLLKPQLVIPVGKLAIAQFMPYRSMEAHVGQPHRCTYADHTFDAMALPHPSGASP